MDKFLPTRAQIASLSEGDYFRDLLEPGPIARRSEVRSSLRHH
jgi:hypothetical protein